MASGGATVTEAFWGAPGAAGGSSSASATTAGVNQRRRPGPLLPLAHSSGKGDAQASEAVAAPSQGESQGLDRMSDVPPPDLIDMVGRWPHP